MSQLRPPRGTHDLLGEEMRAATAMSPTPRATVSARYGYGEIATPIFEFTEVFQRTLGETSDIVTKEMYTFTDRGGDRITLRPENTAGVVRAVITRRPDPGPAAALLLCRPDVPLRAAAEGASAPVPPDRRRAGRRAEPVADVEVDRGRRRHPRAAWRARTQTVLELNTLGDRESRHAYRAVLVAYLEGPRTGCPRTAWSGSSAIRCASSTARTRAIARWLPKHPCCTSISTRPAGIFLRACRTGWPSWASASSSARVWSVASTTTPTRPSSSPRRPSARRVR